MSTTRVLSEIPKSSLEKIVISESEWKEVSYLDIRIFYDASNGQGTDWRPTKRGISIRIEDLEEFEKGINKAIGLLK